MNLFRKKFRLRVLIRINRVSGIAITLIGVLVILSAFAPVRSMLSGA